MALFLHKVPASLVHFSLENRRCLPAFVPFSQYVQTLGTTHLPPEIIKAIAEDLGMSVPVRSLCASVARYLLPQAFAHCLQPQLLVYMRP